MRIFTQEQAPGWARWVLNGETTLLESFIEDESHNHIMFGDLSAWLMEYVAGIKPAFDRPGFREVVLQPCFVTGLEHAAAWYDSIYGRINAKWERTSAGITFTATLPEGVPGKLILPDGKEIAFTDTLTEQIK